MDENEELRMMRDSIAVPASFRRPPASTLSTSTPSVTDFLRLVASTIVNPRSTGCTER